MSASFNLQTAKKEDLSVRLRTHDIKRAKNETKKLEKEGKKMEERLLELKLAMNREKEERERQGGGFWKKGQTGTLNNYAEEVLTKKKNKSASSSGKGKIKILKDKPLDLPDRNNQPGTMAFIAQKGSVTPRDKPKGPKCGQCEERGAAVSCMQCSEDYCAGCFAAFHLKGNLKKHRSVPLMATPRQCFASPRPNPAQTSTSYDFNEEDDGTVVPMYQPPSSRYHGRNSPEGASGTYENNLLNGTYNEAEQAASFQDALNAWRGGGGKGGASESSTNEKARRTPRPVSRVMTPTVNVDTSTGTQESVQEIEIKFSQNISYADKLLLKKHRRTDVDALFTPRDELPSGHNTPRYSARGSARQTPSTHREMSNISMKMEDFDDFDDEERVNFQALFNAVKSSDSNKSLYPDPDTVSIIEVELQESKSEEQVEKSMKYKVKEEGGLEKWNTELQNESSTQNLDVRPPISSKSGRRRSGRKSAKLSQSADLSDTVVPKTDNSQPSARGSVKTERESTKQDSEESSHVLGAKLNDVKNSIQREKSKTSVRFESEVSALDSERLKPPQSKSVKNDQEKARPDSRAKSQQKSRPQSGSRSASRQAQSRSNSRQGSRPSSRANSRMGSARARSRAETPGLLTKGPSEALQQIARMTPTSQPYKGMDSFFMVGVDPTPQGDEERTLTPTEHRDKEGKMKVSYQLYNMAPRSWKPDFSIADSVPPDTMEGEDAEDDRASSVMAYQAYSEMMVTDITERLISRFGELPPMDEDSLSDQSIRSLGEEYRTFTPRDSHNSSLHGSPCMSGRGTPVQLSKSTTSAAPTPRKSMVQDPQPSQTPRQSARSRAQTPRAQSTQKSVKTPRRSKTFHDTEERPESRAIVMEGTDLSIFDHVGVQDNMDNDDEETLDQLEWELASQTGRLTADGKLSRLEVMEDHSDESLNDSMESVRSMSRLGQDHGYDINNKLRKDELEDETALYHATDDEGDVRNLM